MLFLQLEKCRRVVQIAEKSLENTDYFYGIEACNEVLDGHGREIGPTLMHECLCIRAALLLKVYYYYLLSEFNIQAVGSASVMDVINLLSFSAEVEE